MKIFYRISDAGYKKNKPQYISNENCIKNFCKHFNDQDILVIADNVCLETEKMISKYVSNIHKVSIGHGAGTFNIALDMALDCGNNDVVYFVENDYLHKDKSQDIILEGIDLGADFVTLYDHPDKYMDPSVGGNKYCSGGAENTRVYLTKSVHWKLTNSTTMTFASTVSALKDSKDILKKWTADKHPHDFNMFIELITNRQKTLISCIPGYATHGETEWLSPLTDWSREEYV
jgi:hypothetical protein